jgi:hypothetical protein
VNLWWKIVEYDGANVKTLFHGVNGTRIMPVGVWLAAEKKMVTDGSGQQKYLSGFHIMPDIGSCLKYLHRFTNLKTKAFACVEVERIRPKPGSRDPVFLADSMMIIEIESDVFVKYLRDKNGGNNSSNGVCV